MSEGGLKGVGNYSQEIETTLEGGLYPIFESIRVVNEMYNDDGSAASAESEMSGADARRGGHTGAHASWPNGWQIAPVANHQL